jgi:hypothetical protein
VTDPELLQEVADGKLTPLTLDTKVRATIANSLDPQKDPYIKDAIQAFNDRYGDQPSMKSLKSRFITVLERETRTKQLQGPEIAEHAVQIMQDAEDGWFKKKWREWTSGIPSGKGWQELWEDMQQQALEARKSKPERTLPGVPQTRQPMQEDQKVQQSDDSKYIEALKANGKPVTPRNIQALRDQDARRGAK